MSDWRIRKQYGFGAGQVRLAPASRSLVSPPIGPLSGLAQVGLELREGGLSRPLKTVGTTLGLGLLLLLSLLSGFEADQIEETDLQIVALTIPEPLEAEPVSAPSAPQASQPIERTMAPAAVARSMPELPQLPAIDLPEPVEPAILQAAVRKPEPIREAPRPQIQIAAVAQPLEPSVEVTSRASRVVSERFRSESRPAVQVDPVAENIEPRPSRTVPVRVARAARPAPQHAPGRSPATVAPVNFAVSSSQGKADGRLDARPQALRTAAVRDRATARSRKPAALAAATFSAGKNSSSSFQVTQASGRSLVSAPAFTTPARSQADDGLEGVPLSSLAACMSDREEDALKLDLLAAVSRPTECVSPAGRYRFVETKNLNAFLMRIERSSHREEVDRCVELRHALDCLHNEGRYGGST